MIQVTPMEIPNGSLTISASVEWTGVGTNTSADKVCVGFE